MMTSHLGTAGDDADVTQGRTVWMVSAIIEATEQGARDAQEAIERALCPRRTIPDLPGAVDDARVQI